MNVLRRQDINKKDAVNPRTASLAVQLAQVGVLCGRMRRLPTPVGKSGIVGDPAWGILKCRRDAEDKNS